VIPKYAQIKVPNTSPASRNTTKKIQIMRIKDEIKFLYKKKEKLDLELYRCHIQAANKWEHIWHTIYNSITDSVNKEVEKKYMITDRKINKLKLEQTKKPQNSTSFYPTVVSKTDIIFTNEELGLLNKGLKYNLGREGKQWISKLALETEAAATLLPLGEKNIYATKLHRT
jgi:hypothetical protein